MRPSRSRAPSRTKRLDVGILQQADRAGDDQVRAADIEVIAAAAAQIHHLEAGFVLAEMQVGSRACSSPSSSIVVHLAAFCGRELVGALQNRIGKRGGEQVAILERNAFRVDRVDALRFLQAHHIGLAALDHGDCRRRARAAPARRHGRWCRCRAPAPCGLSIASAFLKSPECTLVPANASRPGQLRRVRNAAYAGREDKMARPHDAFRCRRFGAA